MKINHLEYWILANEIMERFPVINRFTVLDDVG